MNGKGHEVTILRLIWAKMNILRVIVAVEMWFYNQELSTLSVSLASYQSFLILTRSCNYCVGNEANMLRVQEPVIIIGDIHGQFFDMIHMFEKVVDPKGIPA